MRYDQNVLKLCCTMEDKMHVPFGLKMLIIHWWDWLKFIEIVLYNGRNNTYFALKMLKIPKFDLWPKCIEIMLYSGRNNAPFGLKVLKIPTFDLDLCPWNDIEYEFLLDDQEILLIPKHSWDMTKMYWNYAVQWKK